MGDNEPINQNDDLIYEKDSEGKTVLIRSVECTQHVSLRFNNRTYKSVHVWWRDYRGHRKLYTTLRPFHYFNVSTFMTHPWEFTEADTGDNLVINKQKVFRPPQTCGERRTVWNICLGVPRSLRETSLLLIANRLRNTASIYQLGLPRMLADELLAVIIQRVRERQEQMMQQLRMVQVGEQHVQRLRIEQQQLQQRAPPVPEE